MHDDQRDREDEEELGKAIAEMDSEDGWIELGVVGQRLPNFASDFDPRTYGCRKLSDLVRKTGAFEIVDFLGELKVI